MTKIEFLPTDYQAPKASNNFMKFQDGENRFRILSQPIIGWEDWTLEKKPVRYHFHDKPHKPIDPKKPIKHFWSMIVWNYLDEEIQILHITQASIRQSIESLCNDTDWGAPYFYDIKVIRKGEAMETEYTVNPVPHKPIADHIKERFMERRCNLEALFHNADPFSKDQTEFTKPKFDIGDYVEKPFIERITRDQELDLTYILDECDAEYKKWFMESIKKSFNANSIKEIPANEFQKVRAAALKTMEDTHANQRKAVKEA